jgi:predicted hotdog family 3-hydroxylacyl-ACP dehydratase
MLLVGDILDHTPEATTCAVEIAADSVTVRSQGRVARWAALEFMAQTVAVHAGLSAWEKGEPVKLGFLIGSRRVDFHGALRVGHALTATARHVWGQASLGLFACSLHERATGQLLAEGQLSVALSETALPPGPGAP